MEENFQGTKFIFWCMLLAAIFFTASNLIELFSQGTASWLDWIIVAFCIAGAIKYKEKYV